MATLGSEMLVTHEKVVAKLRSLKTKAGKDFKATGTVGYTASYAIYVHEDLNVFHPIGQAKFLEIVINRGNLAFARMIGAGMRAGKSFKKCLADVCKRIKEESQALCPVDTGYLRSTAFYRVTG